MTPPLLLSPDGKLTLATREHGDGPPVLLLHGNPDSMSLWDGVVAEVQRRRLGLRLITPDMPGFGSSPPPASDFDYRAQVTVPMWDGFLRELGVSAPLMVVVHDFGGPWLLPWLARNPHRVRGVVLCNLPYSPGFPWHFWARVWQTPLLGELASLVSPRALFRWEMRRGSKGLPVEHCDQAHAQMQPWNRACVLRTYRSHARPSEVWAEELPKLQATLRGMPGRVVWGAADPYISAEEAEIFGLPVQRLDGVGHWSPVERPDAVVDALEAVLRES